MNWPLVLSMVYCCLVAVNAGVNLKQSILVVNDYDPGSCNQTRHGGEVLVKNRADQEIILLCAKDKDIYKWMPVDGTKNTVGEFFNPGYDCSDILDKFPDATDGFYWINLKFSSPTKAWCDMSTDGGGFILIGRKDNPMTYTFPSNNNPVEPFGKPHWTCSFGDAPILDFRVQMATSENFKATKAHWLFRLKSRRALKNLMMTSAGCHQRSAGIGNIAYVKDLRTENIVTTKLRCSKFGYAYHHLAKFGWTKMNSCLQKPCSLSFAYHDLLKVKLDFDGSFSYGTARSISGMEYNATAFVGCDNGRCCGCYGPLGGTKDYCAQNCVPMNGGKVSKNVYTWFWIRSRLPRRLWKTCMDYQVKRDDGKLTSYKLVGHSILPVEGHCNKDIALLHDGIVVVPNSSSAQKMPDIDGLLTYRKDKQELYLRSNNKWKKLAQEIKVNNKLSQLKTQQKTEINQVTKNISQLITKQKTEISQINSKLSDLKTQLKTEINDLKGLLILSNNISKHNQCQNYKWLKERSRNKNFYSKSPKEDDHVTTGWFRFGGAAGTKMPTSCVKPGHCGANGAGWLDGTHPTVVDGKVTRKVCFSVGGGRCCWVFQNIEVINCGQFYIYNFPGTRCTPCRYCGSN